MRVVLSRRANLDLLSHVGWLAQMSPKAAQEAAQTIREQLFTLATFPLAGRVLANDEHKWTIPFGRDGFVAIYRVEPDRVVIARIFHSRQDR